MKKIGLFLLIITIIMEESVDLHDEAGKESEQTLANLSPAEEATSEDEVEIDNFLQEQKSKNIQSSFVQIFHLLS